MTERKASRRRGARPGRGLPERAGELPTNEAIARYVQVLGGRPDLVANLTDHALTVTTTDAVRQTSTRRASGAPPSAELRR